MQRNKLMSNNFGLCSPNDLNFRAWNRQEGRILEDLLQSTNEYSEWLFTHMEKSYNNNFILHELPQACFKVRLIAKPFI